MADRKQPDINEHLYQIHRELADHTDRLINVENQTSMLIDGQQRLKKRIGHLEKDVTHIKQDVVAIKQDMGDIKSELKYNNQLLKQLLKIQSCNEQD